jgi:hypothetical protein
MKILAILHAIYECEYRCAIKGFELKDTCVSSTEQRSDNSNEIMSRSGVLFPQRDKSRQPLPVSSEWVQWRLKDAP